MLRWLSYIYDLFEACIHDLYEALLLRIFVNTAALIIFLTSSITQNIGTKNEDSAGIASS